MARGSLRQRAANDPKSWTLIVELEPDALTGKRRQSWTTFRGDKKAAETALAKLVSKAAEGELSAPKRLTVAAFLEQWLRDHARPNTSPATYTRYEGIIRVNVIPFLGARRLDRLKPADILAWKTALRSAARHDGKPGTLSAATCKHAYVVLHTALEHAVDWEFIPTNPAARVERPKAPRYEATTFTSKQVLAFFAALADDGIYWQALFYVWITSGIRLAELRGLRWEDVDLDKHTIAIRKTFYRVPGESVTKDAKNASGRRPIALDAQAMLFLRNHRAVQNERRLRLGDQWQQNDLVFPGPLGEPSGDKPIRRIFRLACQRAQLPHIRPHDLRHTMATLLLKAKVHPKIVSERLGHSKVSVTLDIYSHVIEGMQEEAAETLGNLLKPPEKDRPLANG